MKQLTSRERLHRCYSHGQIDRPAIYVLWSGLEAALRNTLDATYAPLLDLIREKTDRKLVFAADEFLAPPHEKSWREPYSEDYAREITEIETPKGFLRKKTFMGLRGQPAYVEEHLLKDQGDVDRYLSLPVPGIRGDCSRFFDLDRRIGDKGIVQVQLGLNPAGHVVELFGSELFALLTVENRGGLHALMERECRIRQNLIRFLIEEGVGPYFGIGGEEYLVPPLHGRKDFFDFNVRYDRPLAETIHNGGGWLHIHSHGSIATVIYGFLDIGADVLHPFEAPPMGDITPREANLHIRGKTTFEGNIQVGDLYSLKTSEIRMHVQKLVHDVFPNGNALVVCPTASPYIPGHGATYHRNCAAIVDEVLST